MRYEKRQSLPRYLKNHNDSMRLVDQAFGGFGGNDNERFYFFSCFRFYFLTRIHVFSPSEMRLDFSTYWTV